MSETEQQNDASALCTVCFPQGTLRRERALVLRRGPRCLAFGLPGLTVSCPCQAPLQKAWCLEVGAWERTKRMQKARRSPLKPQHLRSLWSPWSPGALSRWDPQGGLPSPRPQLGEPQRERCVRGAGGPLGCPLSGPCAPGLRKLQELVMAREAWHAAEYGFAKGWT